MKLTDLELSRQIPASPEEVYDVWIDPHSPGGPWFSPNTEHQQSKIIFDAKVDGLFYHRVSAAGQSWIHYGRFTQLERGKVVEHTWVCEATKGRESIVTTTFEPRDGGTFVKLSHTGFPDDEEGRGQSGGWKWVLGALAEAVANRKP
ncbi:MAG: SRPBCC domain-containing protein [Deltaproteobacteria bacterium]|nr:SRPBCC domain-containing protein [Deltaproteobacteria bacterium]MCW5801372.1 SRPBCC domain-containing protein [Deltaproteobacteria bacterium]